MGYKVYTKNRRPCVDRSGQGIRSLFLVVMTHLLTSRQSKKLAWSKDVVGPSPKVENSFQNLAPWTTFGSTGRVICFPIIGIPFQPKYSPLPNVVKFFGQEYLCTHRFKKLYCKIVTLPLHHNFKLSVCSWSIVKVMVMVLVNFMVYTCQYICVLE